MSWTRADLPRLDGRIAVVTGANSGLGLETCVGLAAAGATTVMACRNPAKARAAVEEVRRRVPDAKLELMALDLADLSAVRGFAAAFAAKHPRLDILCNNAGVMTLPYQKTRDGFEMLFGTNHLGHFALTGLLLEPLRAAPGARVVTLSSIAARSGRLPLDDLNWERRRYSKSGAYAQSKLANLVFALELDRRLRKAGFGVLSAAAHPGYAATNIGFGSAGGRATLARRVWHWLIALGNVLLAQPAAMGALPTLYAACAADVQGGDYIGPDGFIQFRGHPVKVKHHQRAADEATARRLWELSEQMTGVRYPSFE